MTEALGALIGLGLLAGFVAFVMWRRRVSKTAQAKETYGSGGGGGGGGDIQQH